MSKDEREISWPDGGMVASDKGRRGEFEDHANILMENVEIVAKDAGHQLQYERMRAGNCIHGDYNEDCHMWRCDWKLDIPCPTDWRECPLSSPKEKE